MKNVVINNVLADMSNLHLDKTIQEFLKMSLTMHLKDYNLVEVKQLPAIEVKDNEWAYQRFTIDMLAKGLANSTIRQYIYAIKNFLNTVQKLFIDVTSQDITDYLVIKQYKDKITASYKRTLRLYLSSFFEWAYNKGYIQKNIMVGVETIKFQQSHKKRIDDLDLEKMRHEIRNIKNLKALFELMLSSGARVGEIANLKIEDLDFDKNLITIWGQKTQTERVVVMNNICKVALLDYLEGRTSGHIFLNARNRKASERTLEDWAKRIGEKVGIPFATTVHIYRKTYASILYRKTSDILLVSKMLGHDSTTTTVKYYLVDDIEEIKHKIQKVN